MNQEIVLSVIIPVYQTEAFLEECLNSVVSQSLMGIEAIVINDGSPDGSQIIINRFCAKYPNFRCINQENSGQSLARNAGISAARGKWITFLDSDDYVPDHAYSTLVSSAERTGADICTGIAQSFNKKRSWFNSQMAELQQIAATNIKLEDAPVLSRDASPCNKVFLRSLILDNNLRFPEGISIREDLHFVFQAYQKARSITIIPTTIYRYRAREDGIQSHTQVVNAKVFNDLVWVYKDLRNRPLDPSVRDALQEGILGNIAYRLTPFVQGSHPADLEPTLLQLEDILSEISSERIEALADAQGKLAFHLIKAGGRREAVYLLTVGFDEDFTTLLARRGLLSNMYISTACIDYQQRWIRRLRTANGPTPSTDKTTTQKLLGNISPLLPKRAQSFINRYASSEIPNVNSKVLARETKLHAAAVIARIQPVVAPSSTKDIWVIGERRGMSAEDTGFVFFNYCRKHHPDLPIYFVTNRNAKGIGRAKKLGNVLIRGSVEANVKLLQAKALIYSDSCMDFYHKWERIAPKLRHDAIGCFLQHGVIGTSLMGGFYLKESMLERGERVDLFIASSEKEKSIIVNELGFYRDEVVVTGLSRFDNLSQEPSSSKDILVIPTWRNWLRTAPTQSVAASDYIQAYQGFINNTRLWSILDKHDLNMRFCLHFAMSDYAGLVRSNHPRISILSTAKHDFQSIIASGALLITDYSSISWDFAYQRRPIIYYQFDADRFYEKRGSTSLDFDAQLMGPVVRTEQALLDELQSHVDSQLKMDSIYRKRADEFFAYTDQRNCERIFQAISDRLTHP